MFKQCVVAGALLIAAGSVSAQQVFFSDFESTLAAEVTGDGSIQGSQGYSAFGFGNNLFRNSAFGDPAGATVLTLINLPAHDAVSLDFLLAAIDSWDSTNGNPSPDLFNVELDGVNIFQATFANTSGSNQYTPPAGGLLIDNGNLGFAGFLDDGFDMSFEPTLHNIPHTASTLTIRFFASGAGWQGGDDESFGIDNLSVTLTQVPTPGAASLAILGVLLAVRRRRQG